MLHTSLYELKIVCNVNNIFHTYIRDKGDNSDCETAVAKVVVFACVVV